MPPHERLHLHCLPARHRVARCCTTLALAIGTRVLTNLLRVTGLKNLQFQRRSLCRWCIADELMRTRVCAPANKHWLKSQIVESCDVAVHPHAELLCSKQDGTLLDYSPSPKLWAIKFRQGGWDQLHEHVQSDASNCEALRPILPWSASWGAESTPSKSVTFHLGRPIPNEKAAQNGRAALFFCATI